MYDAQRPDDDDDDDDDDVDESILHAWYLNTVSLLSTVY